MNLIIENTYQNHEVFRFAEEELKDYWNKMQKKSHALRKPGSYRLRLELTDGGKCCQKMQYPETVPDGYVIHTGINGGVIAGNNPVSVLIGVYAWLQSAGCHFLRPGKKYEIIEPLTDIDALSMTEKKTASFQHRGVCIEGANSLENILDFIDWLPKMGYNSFFLQFKLPYTFMARWYHHENNPLIPEEVFDIKQAEVYTKMACKEMKRRGLRLHQAGHGWTGDVIGYPSVEWKPSSRKPTREETGLMAELNGKRALFHGIPMNTNLCYSSEIVIREFTDAIVRYAVQNPDIDYLHVWLADEYNNVCECNSCRKELLSDQYVRILNMADRKLTEVGSSMRIVFLLYQELLWPPEKERFQNPDRFVLMFAPISRTFEESYHISREYEAIPPYRRNEIRLPVDLNENMAFLRAWQEVFHGDSFVYDYPLGRAHYGDFGYIGLAEVIGQDIEHLEDMGLNGYISCQELRAALPNALPNYIMGKKLFDSSLSEEQLEEEYFSAAYGGGYRQVREYLKKISVLCSCDYFNGKGPRQNKAVAEQMAALEKLVQEFLPVIRENVESCGKDNLSYWTLLEFHSEYVRRLGKALHDLASGEWEEAKHCWSEFCTFLQQNELQFQDCVDGYRVIEVGKNYTGFGVKEGPEQNVTGDGDKTV